MKRGTFWDLGSIIPKIILLTFLTDVGLRLLPVDRFAFRAWEVMVRPGDPDMPLVANKNWHNDRAWGDLASLGNLPELRQYREETFTTDALGYRNPPSLLNSGPPAVLLVGSSFSAGCSVNDDDTLSARLRIMTGQVVYNAAPSQGEPTSIRKLAQRLQMKSGLVICEHPERWEPPPFYSTNPQGSQAGGLVERYRHARRILYEITVSIDDWLNVSRLQILSRRMYRALENNVLLPNALAQNVVIGRLRNGEVMLFSSEILEKTHRSRDVGSVVDYYCWLARELRKSDLNLLVLLVPEKHTVYQPLLVNPLDLVLNEPGYLQKVEEGLRARGVLVANLTAPLQRQAARDLDKGLYVYWRDDTHWNARGISLASEEICKVCAPSGWPRCK